MLTEICALGLSSPVIASYQPTHATSDMSYAEAKIGTERLKGAYAWQTVLSTGGRIGPSSSSLSPLLLERSQNWFFFSWGFGLQPALGSDFPIESIDPLKGFYSALTRLDENGNSPHGKGGW
jgi:predicted amidohydrolase YtcJ